MARRADLEIFADRHGLLMMSIADLIRYRRRTEQLVERVDDAFIPTEWGSFRCVAFRSTLDGADHLAFVRGDVVGGDVLVRVHHECVTGDVFGSQRCDCGPQLRSALRRIAHEERGVVVYLRGNEGRSIDVGGDVGRGRRRGRAWTRAGRQPRVRHRRPDPRGPRRHLDAAHDQQHGQIQRPRRATGCRSPSGCRSRSRPTRTTSRTCGPSATSSGTSSKWIRGRRRKGRRIGSSPTSTAPACASVSPPAASTTT